MLKMRALQKVESSSEPQRSWGVRHCLVLLGAVILLPSSIGTAYVLSTWPSHESPEEVQREYQAMTARESWWAWQELRAVGPDATDRSEMEAHESAVRRSQLWLSATLACAVGGVALIAIPLWLARRSGGEGDPSTNQGDG